ncbi:MAG: peptidylprolyl isomerase [Clostridia bacterium]|nr:peptidylprolyl isomerase [Clostridia bacterium]
MKKVIIIAAAALAAFIAIVAIIYFATQEKPVETTPTTNNAVEMNAVSTSEYAQENDPIVTIEMENGGQMVLQLYPAAAPNTVANFVELAQSGYYNGLTFHRVIPGFMVQGGDPEGTGMGGPGYSIKGEFAGNGVENNISHKRGVISMARSSMPDSAGSQFFIMHADANYLDGQYAAFGEVLSGIEVVDEIAAVTTDSADKPLEDVVIKSITVDTKGVEYTAEKIEE